MSSKQTVYSNDLAGVVVGETAISDVQGEVGLLSYRGCLNTRGSKREPMSRVQLCMACHSNGYACERLPGLLHHKKD